MVTQFRKATGVDIDLHIRSGNKYPPLYAKWDDTGGPLRLNYSHSFVYPSGRIVFLLDDSGNQLLIESDGTSVLGTTTLWVEEHRLFTVVSFNRILVVGTSSSPRSHQTVHLGDTFPEVHTTQAAAEAACDLLRRSQPRYLHQVIEIFNHENLPRE